MPSPIVCARSQIAGGRSLEEVEESLRPSGVGAERRSEILGLVRREYWEVLKQDAKAQLNRGILALAAGGVGVFCFFSGYMPRGALMATATALVVGLWQTSGGLLDALKYARRVE
ncbi:MAG: hypothetical protein H6698_05200 [Myxococcales bacterium]|nr:hypothetical protein [Myxococcales bacterium]MCB9530186.1 hypothetical protein [Myxococcales bacterium]MCB9533699.1 hypothetical protein [Myxococcales bacterium]